MSACYVHPIPARHDRARRLHSGRLGQPVAEHRLDEKEAIETAIDLVTEQLKAMCGL